MRPRPVLLLSRLFVLVLVSVPPVFAGSPDWVIDPAHSEAVISVYRGGMMSSVGHDHIVVAREIHGHWSHDDAGACGAELSLPLSALEVDPQPYRDAAHLTTQPSSADIAGTRAHMHDSVLESKRYPLVEIRVSSCEQQAGQLLAHGVMNLHGAEQAFVVPVTLQKDGASEIITGSFPLRQTAFGMKPYSVLGGVLQVKDEVNIRFHLQANPP